MAPRIAQDVRTIPKAAHDPAIAQLHALEARIP